mgnify:CR=1 FL=1
MSKINVRSPYFVNLQGTTLLSATIEIKIYTGTANTSWQGSPQYTLTSTVVNKNINFEISELIKDYIPAAFNGTYPSPTLASDDDYTAVYVDYKLSEVLTTGPLSPVYVFGIRAFYGYGYFEEGANLNYYKAICNQTQQY